MTILQTSVQKKISPHVLSQFPDFYRKEGPLFIAFVQAYYEWMEEQGPSYDARRLFDYKDIDTTLDQFLIYFKNKYLTGIQLETESNVRFLVKHSLDFYRSRGTPRAIDLLFRLVFGKGAKVYYPWKDLFRTSDGKWHRPRYLEVNLRDDLSKFTGRDVVGITSGASAYVERVVRKQTPTKFVDLLFISSIDGEFQTGELVNSVRDPFPLSECPRVIGSLTQIDITAGGVDFAVGDIVDVVSSQGIGGKARISEIADISGLVDFELISGGYGFTANSEVIVSDKTILLSNVTIGAPTDPEGYFTLFEQVTQPLAVLNYEAATANLVEGEAIFTYHANDDVKGTGQVIVSTPSNATHGSLQISILSGDMDDSTIYTTANAKSITIPVLDGYVDSTAEGNIIAESYTLTVSVGNVSGSFITGESVQGDRGTVVRFSSLGSNGVLVFDRVVPVTTGQTVVGETTGATATVTGVSVRIGLVNIGGTFISSGYAPVRGSNSGTVGYVNAVSSGSGGAVAISSDLIYPETIPINSDLVADYLSVSLAADYGFPEMPNANLNTVIADALDVQGYEVGRISAVIRTNPGEDYDTAPLVRVHEPLIAIDHFKDYLIAYSNSTSSFSPGELLTQDATGARGLVYSANDTHLMVERLKIYGDFTNTTNSTTVIVGGSSGCVANADFIQPFDIPNPRDIRGHDLGLNSLILANLAGGNGAVVTAEVVDSGYGYGLNEPVSLANDDGPDAQGIARLLTAGKGTGYYKRKGGFLSDVKKIHDGDYWQEFSYEVRSSVNYSRYRDMLRELLHVAGTKSFGSFHHSTVSRANTVSHPSMIALS